MPLTLRHKVTCRGKAQALKWLTNDRVLDAGSTNGQSASKARQQEANGAPEVR